ncbi:peptidoglycan-binding protein [Ochrobactrum sp. MYb15]|uniref:L,D-transpeptidase family protein n=1 Tax=Brucella TaxID=234 RepID=UPI00046346BD|nr:L,D-transpeptidase family protein [Brucella rhizosphaerae]PQZ51981.1 peptidoglycan-binding protein [Ochrobactrum sp. MYb19]PRA62671.1 peptidoglycan-binding protein [Ochrobactrum sp. MYb18]PRA76675.1 peptidoglycan-binding protein [Brucella thiophenivorans]PRA93692.1 peptidoglycan-binding protein [Ochrobactrum sp. MYb14]PRA98682.1 peptidoglycan-binding protein [Ochrobactrum sp. MYb15]
MQFSRHLNRDINDNRKSGPYVRNALAFALAASTLFSTAQAQAANSLLELFQQRRQQQAQPPVQAAPVAPERRAAKPVSVPRAAVPPAQRVTVKGPQIYNYKPDALIKVDFSAVDMQVTAAVDPAPVDPLTSGMSPIGRSKKVDETQGERAFDAATDYLKTVDVKAEKQVAEAIVSFYSEKRTFLWSSDNKALDKARNVAAFFAQADDDGLNPEEYAVATPGDHFDEAELTERQQKLADFEIRMSARALRYAIDAGEGRVVADRLSGFHDLPRGRVDPKAVLARLASESDPVAYLKSFQPNNEAYASLKRELAQTEAPAGEPIRISLDKAIRPGDTNDQLGKVVALITRHAPASYLEQHRNVLQAHADASIYDPELAVAIKDYQKLSGSTPDGIIGKNTIAALQGEQDSVKRDRILYSMERLRWLPHDFGSRYVMVNQPSYRAEYFEHGKEKLAMNVVIGSPTHQTYFFYNKVQTVVFNPSWGVPRSIILNEMLPKVMRDTSYLDRNGYEVYVGGKKVSASAVNWSAVAAGKAHVGIRQKPSLDNALGELKILFPNAHDIYMHDTPAKSYFSRDMRALSHGCIRLERPRDMAAAVLGKPVEELGKYFGKDERGLKVANPVPVYIAYFTAWPDANGNVRFFNDIYDRDSGLQKAFDKTAESRLAAL